MSLLLPTLALTAHLCATPTAGTIAGVALYNPTNWAGPALVEVPTGRIAAPGLIDWNAVRLAYGGEEIPFALREGSAHWRASLTPVSTPPRAEDLLVFWCPVPPGEWVRVDIVPGASEAASSAISSEGASLTVQYDHMRADLDRETGLLQSLRLHGQEILAAPMSAGFQRVDPDSFATTGAIGAGFLPFEVDFARGQDVPWHAALQSTTSTPTFTELNYLLTPEEGPDMALTWRFHATGMVEATIDERPWRGTSPWMRSAARFNLALAGTPEVLPYLEERMPFYGFKDYNAAFDQVAEHRVLGETHLLAVGEETVNGRRWQRRLYAWPEADGMSAEALEMLDEGLVVTPVPVCSDALADTVRLAYPAEAKTVAEELIEVLRGQGLAVREDAATTLRMVIEPDAMASDGYDIRSERGGEVTLRGENLLGLYRAVRAVATHAQRHKLSEGLPLIAENPVVPLRGGGFGGGNFEVDFPYGSEDFWKDTFDGLLDSGMNVFWCLGMWGNWKLPISYRYMPELQSDDPDAYDEATGVLFSELEEHRAHGLRLLNYLHERGAPVYLWLPIGCVPTTFLDRFPEALKLGSVEEFWGRPKGTPCFTHPTYKRYVDAFLRELVEVYSLDGVVLVRDDNGGICDCDRCKAFVAESRTKSAAWEQYLQIYDAFRALGFEGKIGVYPYFDGYTPALDPLLPEDMLVAGHGASLAALARRHDLVGHMPDTWLDNLYTNFRLPSTPRVRRLLADRGTFWIGGAYCGTELPWEGLGYFGWEPTSTANSLRYHWGERTFGADAALSFVAMNDAYEALWDVNARYLVPNVWVKLTAQERDRVTREGMGGLAALRDGLAALKDAANPEQHATWFAHLDLWPVFFEYHLRRMGRFAEVYDLVREHGEAIDAGRPLPDDARATVLAKYAEVYDWGERYRDAVAVAPGDMLKSTRHLTMPYKEWMSGCDGWLDPQLERPQFRGTLKITPVKANVGSPFTLSLTLHNTGVCPWVERAQQRLAFSEEGRALGLPDQWILSGEPIAPGDRRELTFTGTAPADPGSAEVTVAFHNPYRTPGKFAEEMVTITWGEADRGE